VQVKYRSERLSIPRKAASPQRRFIDVDRPHTT
jgi:hypothetical protein